MEAMKAIEARVLTKNLCSLSKFQTEHSLSHAYQCLAVVSISKKNAAAGTTSFKKSLAALTVEYLEASAGFQHKERDGLLEEQANNDGRPWDLAVVFDVAQKQNWKTTRPSTEIARSSRVVFVF